MMDSDGDQIQVRKPVENNTREARDEYRSPVFVRGYKKPHEKKVVRKPVAQSKIDENGKLVCPRQKKKDGKIVKKGQMMKMVRFPRNRFLMTGLDQLKLPTQLPDSVGQSFRCQSRAQ